MRAKDSFQKFKDQNLKTKDNICDHYTDNKLKTQGQNQKIEKQIRYFGHIVKWKICNLNRKLKKELILH